MNDKPRKPPRFTPTNCPHCEYDRRFPPLECGGWLQQDNNGPIVPCPMCNDDGKHPRIEEDEMNKSPWNNQRLEVGMKALVGPNTASLCLSDHDEQPWLGTITYIHCLPNAENPKIITVGVAPDNGGLPRDVLVNRILSYT